MGLVPKKTSGWHLITHLSIPPGNSVNDFIDEKLTTVQYSKFDNVISIIQTLGEHVRIGKIYIKSAFRLLPCYPEDFDLHSFKIGDLYYIDKCMLMGCSISCSTFEKFSTFLQWFVQEEHGLKKLDHYLDDFFFAEMSDIECSNSMFKFKTNCKRLGVPIADEKTEVPVTSIEFLGLTIDTESMSAKILGKKIKELLKKLNEVAFSKKSNFETIAIIMW